MTLIEELHAARKARLVRLGASPNRRCVKELNQILAEQADLIADIKHEIPAVVAEWVKRQRAITKELRAAVQEAEHARPSVAAIQTVTAAYFKVDRHDILSARRTADIVRPRQIAMFLCKTLTLRSLPDIGRKFGGRDHTTVLHGVRKVERLIRQDWEWAHDVAHVEALLA